MYICCCSTVDCHYLLVSVHQNFCSACPPHSGADLLVSEAAEYLRGEKFAVFLFSGFFIEWLEEEDMGSGRENAKKGQYS